MNELLASILMTTAISSMRHDDAVARQGVMNHQTTSHIMDLNFTRDAVEMSIPESYAIQGLSHASAPRDAMGASDLGPRSLQGRQLGRGE